MKIKRPFFDILVWMAIKYLSGDVKEAVVYKSGFRIKVWVLDRNLKSSKY